METNNDTMKLASQILDKNYRILAMIEELEKLGKENEALLEQYTNKVFEGDSESKESFTFRFNAGIVMRRYQLAAGGTKEHYEKMVDAFEKL